MNLADYTRAKFQIADILRSATRAARAAEPDNLFPFEDLFGRLAEDRFTLAVIGQFSRGKTSLMNAMLKTDRLPVGIVPLTSVITAVQYGPSERATVEYRERRLPNEISLDALPEFVTQAKNPGNQKDIRFVRIELPSELLRKGFYLVDTPGLGSAIAANTRTTEDYLPQADAFLVVTSYDSPLSADEIRILGTLSARGYRVFLILNKQDLADENERVEVERHVLEQLREIVGQMPEVFSLSAREALEAYRSGNTDLLIHSGLAPFLARLTHFLVEERQTEFMRRMFARAGEALAALPDCADEQHRLLALQRGLGAIVAERDTEDELADTLNRSAMRFSHCEVCAEVETAVREFLQTYQYAIVVDREIRETLRANLGLCSFHTWQYASMASAHGTCVAFPAVLERFAEAFREALSTTDKGLPHGAVDRLAAERRCVLCDVHAAAERQAVATLASRISREPTTTDRRVPGVCFPHLSTILKTVEEDAARTFLAQIARYWARTAEDMHRYALKRDGSRRAFTTQDELDADLCGLRALGGHRALHFVGRFR